MFSERVRSFRARHNDRNPSTKRARDAVLEDSRIRMSRRPHGESDVDLVSLQWAAGAEGNAWKGCGLGAVTALHLMIESFELSDRARRCAGFGFDYQDLHRGDLRIGDSSHVRLVEEIRIGPCRPLGEDFGPWECGRGASTMRGIE
jgi:hypothetical protein